MSYLRCKLYADSGKQKLCTRHSIRLDKLIEVVSERIRYYVRNYYNLEETDIPKPDNTRNEMLKQEEKSLISQVEKRNQAIKSMYLDKISGILSEEQLVELNQAFLSEKSQLERRLAQIREELEERVKPIDQISILERAEELLRLDTIPRELVVALIEKIEVGERDPESGKQEVRITWKF